MALTYTPIAKTQLGATATSITFSNINQSYTDLVLKFNMRYNAYGSATAFVLFNGETTSNTTNSYQYIQGNASSPSSSRSANTVQYINRGIIPNTYTANIFSVCEWYIPNYSQSSYYKSATIYNTVSNASSAADESYVLLEASLRKSTDAITSLEIQAIGGNPFAIGSVAYLYGITKA
jgi:hypothetical protein